MIFSIFSYLLLFPMRILMFDVYLFIYYCKSSHLLHLFSRIESPGNDRTTMFHVYLLLRPRQLLPSSFLLFFFLSKYQHWDKAILLDLQSIKSKGKEREHKWMWEAAISICMYFIYLLFLWYSSTFLMLCRGPSNLDCPYPLLR